MKHLLMALLCLLFQFSAYADSLSSLTLTDAEMQKLKKYFPVEETGNITWKGDPILITLLLNKEKRIVFPTSLSVDLKGGLSSTQLRVINNDKSLYLTALTAFEKTRVYVTSKESGKVILLDVMTDESASNTTQKIEFSQNENKTNSHNQIVINESKVINQHENATQVDALNYADLIRFAWQQTYAPERLIPSSSQFTRAAMHTNPFISDLIYGDKVIAHPTTSWMAGEYYVTAIELRNKYAHPTKIDIHRDMCGEWQAATLFPRTTLKPYGDQLADSTTLFVVSNKPFGEAMGVCHGNA